MSPKIYDTRNKMGGEAGDGFRYTGQGREQVGIRAGFEKARKVDVRRDAESTGEL